MGIYGEDIYNVHILYEHWWQYVPFRNRIVYGKEKAFSLIKRLTEQRYNFEISEKCFYSGDFSFIWVIPPVSLLEKEIEESTF